MFCHEVGFRYLHSRSYGQKSRKPVLVSFLQIGRGTQPYVSGREVEPELTRRFVLLDNLGQGRGMCASRKYWSPRIMSMREVVPEFRRADVDIAKIIGPDAQTKRRP